MRSRVRAHLCGGALALMPLGLEGASEIVAAPLVSSHEYALQQHSTIDAEAGIAISGSRPAGLQVTSELQAAGSAALRGQGLHQARHLHRGCANSMIRSAQAVLQLRC